MTDFFSSHGILILIGFALLMFVITRLYRKVTGKEMDFSKTPEAKDTEPSAAEEWLNDRKLTERWQVAEDMTKVNEGTIPIKNKEDRFHLTPTNEEIVDKR